MKKYITVTENRACHMYQSKVCNCKMDCSRY